MDLTSPTHERMDSGVNNAENPQGSTVELMTRNWQSVLIRIRSKPEGLGELSNQTSYIDLKEHLESETKVKGAQLLDFGTEPIIQGNSQAYNSLSSTLAAREVFEDKSSYNKTLINGNGKTDTKCWLSCDKIAAGHNRAGKSLLRHLLRNKIEDNYKSSVAVAELFSVSETLSSSVDLSANCFTDSNLRKQNSNNLETLGWRNFGVLSEKNDQKCSIEFYTDKNSKLFAEKTSPGNDRLQRKVDDSIKTDNTPTSSLKTLDFPVSKDIGTVDLSEVDKNNQKSSSVSVKSFLKVNPLGCDAEKRCTDCLIPRKRPRKSIPKKLNPDREYLYSDLHRTCSEETLSANEIIPELSPQRCTTVASPVREDECTPIISSRRDSCKPLVSLGKGQQSETDISTVMEEQKSTVVSFEMEGKDAASFSAEREEQRSPVVSTEKEKKSAVAVSFHKRQNATEPSPEKEIQSISKVSPGKRDLCEPCVFSDSTGSHRVSCGGTRIVFRRTGGVWSVSSPTNLGVGIDGGSEGTFSSGKATGKSGNAPNAVQDLNDSCREKPTAKICLFTDQPIASLSSADEHYFSTALDRETRIKELLSRQEKLLAQMRQQAVTSQNIPDCCTTSYTVS
ncbi:uncharacterized protein LOC111330603 isoform X2 [Stylophora pistillata]|uniref:uncharacterized protein LOC111330603 isoform X2 n=1 Tax=Stylophora pistillata TaxID=50429 RepID=UPI000C05784E|nr:uncharacterized protein LOC111330603 isoform X2 [Stylophora pistillata]